MTEHPSSRLDPARTLAGLVLLCLVSSNSTLARDQAEPAPSQFALKFEGGVLVSLKRAHDRFETEYVQPGRRLGDVVLRYRKPGGEWRAARTAEPVEVIDIDPQAEGEGSEAVYDFGDDGPTLRVRFEVRPETLTWTLAVANPTGAPLEIGDLAVPLPMNSQFRRDKPATNAALKHSFISGDGSYLFWMRSNSVGPYLAMVPEEGTSLEYWDTQGGYRVYIHSAAAGAEAQAKGTNWRQPHTSRTLAPKGQPGDTASYGFRFRWADDTKAVRQLLVDEGKVDVQVVPGMTVPSDLDAQFALRTHQPIQGIEPEFPDATRVDDLGVKGDYHLYRVKFAKLGENRLDVRYGQGRRVSLEFFATEPLETLIKKRAAFIAAHQHRDPSKWYNGLLAEWNMETGTLLGPDNHDRIKGWRIYEFTCDDPGLSKPAFLAAKNAEFPVQAEIDALDYYLEHFVWGGLQRTTDESHPFGIYGIPDWKANRESPDPGSKGKLHIWRPYDFPHILLTYFSLYRTAKRYPEIHTALPAEDYLRRAAGTAIAMFTVPAEVAHWTAYGTGFYNELVIVDLIDSLRAAGLVAEADTLRGHWERKVRYFVNEQTDLFGSEYPFDSTGFESTHALARHALTRPVEGVTPEAARKFLDVQMAANRFCRGTTEPAYYLLGSDYRGSAGNAYTLSYMAQMGGWAVLDHALNFSSEAAEDLRLGYASYLSAWALVNSGTPESNYGYWFPGLGNDGGSAGGFEPAPWGRTWLEQPHHRGPWYYSCESDLGYCGALRTAATVLADDPIFGRTCFGGDWKTTPEGPIEIVPKDGLRRRLHARIGGKALSLISETDRFPAGRALTLNPDLAAVNFFLEGDNPEAHAATLRLSGVPAGRYSVSLGDQALTTFTVEAGREAAFEVPIAAGSRDRAFTLAREPAAG